MQIKIIKGDITNIDVDAIVNPSNSYGFMGGGVAGFIKSIGGEEIQDEAVANAPIPVGYAIITTGGKLKCKVIHASTMEQPAQKINAGNVREAMRAALECAEENKVSCIACPGLGTGVGGVDKKVAAKAMIMEIKRFKGKYLQMVVLIDMNDDLVKAWEELA